MPSELRKMNSLSLIVLVITGLTAGSSAKSCTGLEVLECRPHVIDSSDKDNKGWMETQEKLEKHCNIEIALLECLYKHISPCDDNTYIPHLSTYLLEQRTVYNHVCQKGSDLNTKYIKHAKCMNRHDSTVEDKCGSIRDLENPVNIEENCKAFAETLKCALKEVENNCSKDARIFVEEFIKPSVNFAKAECPK